MPNMTICLDCGKRFVFYDFADTARAGDCPIVKAQCPPEVEPRPRGAFGESRWNMAGDFSDPSALAVWR